MLQKLAKCLNKDWKQFVELKTLQDNPKNAVQRFKNASKRTENSSRAEKASKSSWKYFQNGRKFLKTV